MALSNTVKAAIERSTWAHLSDDPTALSSRLRDSIAEHLGITSGYDKRDMLKVIREARAAWQTGQSLQDDPTAAAVITPTARDYTIDNTSDQYRYRVLVEVTDPDTLNVYSNVVLVDSDRPLSASEIRADAMQMYTSLRGPDREYVSRSQVGASSSVDVVILTGGRV